MADVPSYNELPTKGGARCAWDVWRGREAFGALNLLTPQRVVAASHEVQRGAVFALDLSLFAMSPPLFNRSAARHEVFRKSDTSQDDVIHSWNTQSSSQWDGFRHVRFPGHGHFGGLPDSEHGVHHWAKTGIVGRALVVDVARYRAAIGRPLQLAMPDPISAADVEACLRAQGTQAQPGDILLVRTGWLAWYMGLPEATRADLAAPANLRTPGLAPSEDMAQLLWDLHIAAIAADNPALEVWPIGALLDENEARALAEDGSLIYRVLLHIRLLAMLGIVIGELFDLDRLADDCALDGRYSCFVTSSPLNVPAGVASPPNILAVK